MINNTLKQSEIIKVLSLALTMQNENPRWRVGQCVFNSLFHLFPDSANEIRATENDPFYLNENLMNFHNSILDKN